MAAEGFKSVEPVAEYRRMVMVHTGWFLGMLIEGVLFQTPLSPAFSVFFGVLFLSGQLLRIWALNTLGPVWNTQVYVPSEGSRVVVSGPYRFIRHPNYLAVIVEFFSLPMALGAPFTAVLFSILNGLILNKRITVEEQALRKLPEYQNSVGNLPAFIPRF